MLILLSAASGLISKLRSQPLDLPDEPPALDMHPLEIFYDVPRDTLYISLGGPRASIACEMVGGVLIRYVPKTNIIVGVTILNLSSLAERPIILPILMSLTSRRDAE